jgi:glycosyltransferase involved in cell wall biosynthesis
MGDLFDVGIMPIRDQPFERGKCGFKLIQYGACGLPVVASDVGVNREIVEQGETGFLATQPADWREALLRLAADTALRARLGTANRVRIEARYDRRVAREAWTRILKEHGGAGSSS